jgi:plasmid rolling circle replication initiator protein Rep
MQYFFTDKKELMLHHGDAFTWTIPLIAKSMKEMCLNLVEFTNADNINLEDEEEDAEFKELIEFVDNELNFTGGFCFGS